MAGNNLPDDVSPSDVDEAMRPPEQHNIVGVVKVSADVVVPEYYDDSEAEGALMERVGRALNGTEFAANEAEIIDRWPKPQG